MPKAAHKRQPLYVPKPVLAHPRRRSGYVTQALINEHGSFRAALAWLNEVQP